MHIYNWISNQIKLRIIFTTKMKLYLKLLQNYNKNLKLQLSEQQN